MIIRTELRLILLFSLFLIACQLPGILAGSGSDTPTPDVYMTAAAGAQTRNAIQSETSVAEFLSPTVPPAATSVPPQTLAPTIAPQAQAPSPTAELLPAPPTSAPPPTSIQAFPATSSPNTPAANLSGTHAIVNLHTQKCIQPPSDPNANNVPVIQATCSNANTQLWDINSEGNGYYQLVSRNSGKCLDVEFKRTAQNYDLVQSTCDNTPSQHWRFDTIGSYSAIMSRSNAAGHAAAPIDSGTYYQIVAQHSNMCADLNAWMHDDGAHILQYPCAASNNDNQLWALK